MVHCSDGLHMGHRLIPGVGEESVHPLQGLELGGKVRAYARKRRVFLSTTEGAIGSKIWQMPTSRESPKAERGIQAEAVTPSWV